MSTVSKVSDLKLLKSKVETPVSSFTLHFRIVTPLNSHARCPVYVNTSRLQNWHINVTHDISGNTSFIRAILLRSYFLFTLSVRVDNRHDNFNRQSLLIRIEYGAVLTMSGVGALSALTTKLFIQTNFLSPTFYKYKWFVPI